MKNKDIKISVMIPVYNTSKYLEKCLNSVINQSLKEIEIVCVNDGSTDNSLEILKNFQQQDERLIIVNKKNSGVSSARNEALKIIKGEYCLNIDSDDWIEQNFLEEMYLKAKKDNLDLVISDIIFDYQNRIEIVEELKIKDSVVISGEEYRELFFNKKLRVEGYTWNKLIRTNFYKNNNILFNEEVSFLEDYEVILKLAYYLKRIGKLNKAYYHYIQRKNSASNNIQNVEKNFCQTIQVFNNLENFYKNRDKKICLKLKKEKIFSMQYSIFKNKEESEKIYDLFLFEIKKEKFIFKKNEGEKLGQILLFNIVKLFNSKLIIKFIKELL